MDIGSEISEQIRVAIKGKLQQLGSYVDEELPDYIMVMVANKKAAPQMAEDLSLFLGKNTVSFTVWLHGVLQQLRSATVEPARESRQSLYAEGRSPTRKHRAGPCRADHSAKEYWEQDGSGLRVGRTRSLVSNSLSTHGHHRSSDRTSCLKSEDGSVAVQERAAMATRCSTRPSVDFYRPRHPTLAPESMFKGSRSTQVLHGPGNPKHIHRRQQEEDRVNQRNKTPEVDSVVRGNHTSGGGHGGYGKRVEEYGESYGTKISCLSHNTSLAAEPEFRPFLPPLSQANMGVLLKAISESQPFSFRTTNHAAEVQGVPPSTLAHASGGDSRFQVDAGPKFIVTLDGMSRHLGDLGEVEADLGVGANLTKRPLTADNPWKKHEEAGEMDEEEDEEDEEHEEEDEGAVPVKRQKVLERCKFWPMCRSGDDCPYQHPATQCKAFPNCKFGAKCLFVHPDCKYHPRCTNGDCPYTHNSAVSALACPAGPQATKRCRFFPDCKKMDCQFYHPKPCRFTTQCNRADCPFYHPPLSMPLRQAFKWSNNS